MKLKHLVIQRFAGKYSIRSMCRFFCVSESGYYAFAKRQPQDSKDEPLRRLIAQCQQATRYTYGYRRICLWLRKAGVCVNHKAVLRIMQKYGLLARVRRKRHYYQYGEYLLEYPNQINRKFEANRPNQKWVTDISFIKTKQGILYLSVIKDLYDGFIVAYKTARRNDNYLVLQTLRQAQKEAADGLVLHSDQGFQYASTAYRNLTQQYDITPSMSRKGTPLDNAPVESFFSTLKTECLYRQKIESFNQANSLIYECSCGHNHTAEEIFDTVTIRTKRKFSIEDLTALISRMEQSAKGTILRAPKGSFEVPMDT